MGAYFYYVDRQGGRGGVRKMPILLNKMSTKGGGGGQKSLKSCLRSKSMPPMCVCAQILWLLNHNGKSSKLTKYIVAKTKYY